MSFLQPALLWALPLAALPIIIHLINQRRYQTIRWAAMMFLLAANRMSRGYARIRQWLIMACRIAAIGGLIFAVSRPLGGGWIGAAAGSRADTTFILLDRSPSMEQEAPGGRSKRQTALEQLVPMLKTLGSARWVLIDGARRTPMELESIDALPRMPDVAQADASSDLPAMLQAAHDAIRASRAGRTEVWIVSDVRANDWDVESGRWPALRDAFLAFPQGVRFHLLAYPEPAPANLAVRVSDVRRVKAGESAELLVSLELTREGGGDDRQTVPVHFEIDGARSELPVELAGPKAQLKDHRIPLGRGQARGWGRVSIPADSNPADNDYWFAFAEPAERRAVVVAEDETAARTLRLAAEVAPDPAVRCSAEVVAVEQLASVEWEATALLLWQAPLPQGEDARLVRAFVERGGQVVFLPPGAPGDAEFLGVRWTTWNDAERAVESWRGDQDLLAHTQSGAPLPVGALRVARSCGLSGELTPLATLRGGAPLLARLATPAGGAYFCATTPAPGDSSLAVDGVVLYVMTQRALAAGALPLEGARPLVAGDRSVGESAGWTFVAGSEAAVSTEYPLHAGVYSTEDRLLAVNRADAESPAPVLADARVAELFRGLDYSRVDARAGSTGSLIQEIWRLFLVGMMGVLVAEAALCLPKTVRRAGPTP
jgi:hypothetical protein